MLLFEIVAVGSCRIHPRFGTLTCTESPALTPLLLPLLLTQAPSQRARQEEASIWPHAPRLPAGRTPVTVTLIPPHCYASTGAQT